MGDYLCNPFSANFFALLDLLLVADLDQGRVLIRLLVQRDMIVVDMTVVNMQTVVTGVNPSLPKLSISLSLEAQMAQIIKNWEGSLPHHLRCMLTYLIGRGT